jgi:hypothetical protein
VRGSVVEVGTDLSGAIEDEIIALASAAIAEGVPSAMENYLMTLLEHREQAKYLLRQQTGR